MVDAADMIVSLFLGAAGLAVGFSTPQTVGWIIAYKRRAKDAAPAQEGFSLPVRLLLTLLSTAVWALAGLVMDSIAAAVLVSLLFSTAVLIAVIDLRIRLIPNELVLFLLAIGTAFQIASYGLRALPGSLLCMAGMMVLFTLAAAFVGFGKVGAGDVKLAGAMGLALGYPGIITALVVLCAALLLFSLGGILAGKLTRKSMLPFAPFMSAGMAAALLCVVLRIAPLF